MAEKVKKILYQYRHGVILSYFLVYIGFFMMLEENVRVKYVMRSWLDAYIPFQEAFIIPYFMWFFYVGSVIVYLMLKSKRDFYRACMFLFTGMSLCLVFYALFPNGQYLRPHVFPRDNFLVDMVRYIYAHDTPTNVCPSIHVLNSIGINIAVQKSEVFRNRRKLRRSSTVLMILICMSTVFLKQHSVIDVICAILLSIPLYLLAYRVEWKRFVPLKEEEEPISIKQGSTIHWN
ncbi:phosphatase PAP2 family protein [Papillibacter cinnamivorans]|uniref:PAP2 superfamily protein n=1 Tax=Papillibacter cinnamivorans DSM 12816 TaxID=1122930 RepID=A0A1W2BUI2_9FIRM|nr:phosphatase PAP2 family protein [Papillibacter cinnamivorans]SMC76541.1 hypothetical protein SAMN02745168_2389 [Papillibacter cinnamivorans DSM 12816]